MNMVWKCQTDFQPDFDANLRASREKRSHSIESSPWQNWSSLCGYTHASVKKILASTIPDAPPPNGPPLILGLFRCGMNGSILGNYTAIAKAFASHFKSDYLAGLWRGYLIYDLMWGAYPATEPEVSKSGSPSWSWAGMNGKVTFIYGHEIYATAEVLDCTATLAFDSALYGAVTGGELVICGYLKEVRVGASQAKLLDETGEIIPATYFRSDGDYGACEKSPGFGTLNRG